MRRAAAALRGALLLGAALLLAGRAHCAAPAADCSTGADAADENNTPQPPCAGPAATATPTPSIGFQCAKLPPLPPREKIIPDTARLPYVALRSIASLSASAPLRDALAEPEKAPYECVPPLCRSSAASKEECERFLDEFNVELRWDGESRTDCGADYKGWGLGFEDVVIGVPVSQAFLDRIDEQVGMGGGNGTKRLRAAFHLPGAWWNVTAFRKVSLLLMDQCTKQQRLHSDPGRCAHTDTTSADIRTIRAAGAERVRHAFWNDTESALAAEAEAAFDAEEQAWAFDAFRGNERKPFWRLFEADKTRRLFLEMMEWRPDAHFYIKVDTDVILYPERLLRFLRTLEGAIGTRQPAYFGHFTGAITAAGYMQGSAYGFNRAALLAAKADGRLSLESLDALVRAGVTEEDRAAGWWGAPAYHFHCGQFFPGQGKDYTVRVNRMREAITYHHLNPAMLRPLGLSALDPADICAAPELRAAAPPPPAPPPPPPEGDRRRRRRNLAAFGGAPQVPGEPARAPRNPWFCPETDGVEQVAQMREHWESGEDEGRRR